MADKDKKQADKGNTSTALAEAPKSMLERLREGESVELTDVAREATFDELLAAIPADELIDVSELGDGFFLMTEVNQKKLLVGKAFLVMDYRSHPGRFKDDFYTMRIKTKNPVEINGGEYTNLIVNDGSTGIAAQLRDYEERGEGGKIIRCMRGLRVSEYDVQEEYIDGTDGKTKVRPVVDPATGKPVRGQTFYLDTSL